MKFKLGDKLFPDSTVDYVFEVSGIYPAGQNFNINISGCHYKVSCDGYTSILSEDLLSRIMCKGYNAIKDLVTVNVGQLKKDALIALATMKGLAGDRDLTKMNKDDIKKLLEEVN